MIFIKPKTLANRFAVNFLSLLMVMALITPITLRPTALHAQGTTCAQDAVVQSGDTLSTLSGQYLGNPQAYQRIVDATNRQAAINSSYATIANVNIISVGWKLCIPTGDSSTVVSAPTTTVPTPDGEVEAGVESLDYLELLERMGPDGVHPLSIDYLRTQQYPGSEVTILQTLAPGVNYNQYVVSYLSEGIRINALLTIPLGERPATGWPTIVFNHGYIPPEIYRTTERYVAYVETFARNGYIVFKPDYRGHGFSEGEPRSAYGAPDYTIDVLNAVATVKQHPDVDPNRIGMWGHSMGGYITLRSMVTREDIQAGVIWAGVVASYEDLLALWRPNRTNIPERARRWRDNLIDEHGTPTENPIFWDSISANTYVNELSGPIQLHHGVVDTSVPVIFSDLLHEDIEAVDGAVEMYTYPFDDHNISTSFGTAMERSVAFFDAHVKNAPLAE